MLDFRNGRHWCNKRKMRRLATTTFLCLTSLGSQRRNKTCWMTEMCPGSQRVRWWRPLFVVLDSEEDDRSKFTQVNAKICLHWYWSQTYNVFQDIKINAYQFGLYTVLCRFALLVPCCTSSNNLTLTPHPNFYDYQWWNSWSASVFFHPSLNKITHYCKQRDIQIKRKLSCLKLSLIILASDSVCRWNDIQWEGCIG